MRRSRFSFTAFEIGASLLAFLIIVGVTIPNFFGALKNLRGSECSSRLRLVAECMHDLVIKNYTKPGETICSTFDLNDQLLERQDRATHSVRIGAEPDCPDIGEFSVNLTLSADGSIVMPTCSLGVNGDFAEADLHSIEKWEPAWQEELRLKAADYRRRLLEAQQQAKQEQQSSLLDLSPDASAPAVESATTEQ